MAILTVPSTGNIQTMTFGPTANTLDHTSSLDRTTQTVELVGVLWQLSVTMQPMRPEDGGEDWATFLSELAGEAGRFYAGDLFRTAPLGSAKSAPGTPLVNGASQTGRVVTIDGAPASATGYLLRGDYAAWDLPSGGRSMHKVTADANSNGSGEVSLSLFPPLRESPADNAPVLISPASCVMKLVDDDQAPWRVRNDGLYEVAFGAVEAVNAA